MTLLTILALYAASSLTALLGGRRLGKRVFLVAAAPPVATAAYLVARAPDVIDGAVVTDRWSWVPRLGVELSLRLDGFALVMLTLVVGVGIVIVWYSATYPSPGADIGRYAALFTAFGGSMVGLVLAENLLILYVFWELTSITSYLLIGFEDDKPKARAAALQALLVTSAGGLVMLAGLVVLGQAAGSYSLPAILDAPPGGVAAGAGLVMILVGAFTKSAQVPFHSWLPAAMAAPTPVSAYLHSATMVKAGVYLVARLAPVFAAVWTPWRPVVMGVGAATMLVGGCRALRQHDAKLLLAFGTISQLGLLMVLFGAGEPALTVAATALLLAHGLFKAALFMVVGIVDHQTGERDIRRLSGLAVSLPATFVVAALAVLSMAGIPPLFGFVAKEASLEGLLHADAGRTGTFALAAVAAGSVLTMAYGARFLWGVFGRGSSPPAAKAIVRPGWAFVAPAAILAIAGLAAGIAPNTLNPLIDSAARGLDAAAASHLRLWHGFTASGGLSLAIITAGIGMFVLRAPIERFQEAVGHLPSTDAAYRGCLAAVNRLAGRVTGIAQCGSLPIYAGVIMLTVLLVPGMALLQGSELPTRVTIAASPIQFVASIAVVALALAAASSRQRFVAVLCLGGVGYGVAVLFVVQGAPDLALTQLLIETIAIVAFILVLRHLPRRFSEVPWRLGRALRLITAGGVGVFVAAFALVAGEARRSEPVSSAFVERALPEAGGRNVVNVILVDFRALDTLGELTVLAVAAFGITSLVLAGRATRSPSRRPPAVDVLDRARELVDHGR